VLRKGKKEYDWGHMEDNSELSTERSGFLCHSVRRGEVAMPQEKKPIPSMTSVTKPRTTRISGGKKLTLTWDHGEGGRVLRYAEKSKLVGTRKGGGEESDGKLKTERRRA